MKVWTFTSGNFFYSDSEQLSRSKAYDGEVLQTSPGVWRAKLVPCDSHGRPT